MKFPRWSLVAAALLPALAPLASQAPKPPTEVAKLAEWVGTWKYEGEAKATPLGPAAKFTGTQTGKMVLNGFFLQWSGEEKGVFGNVQWMEMDWYDVTAKSYPFTGQQNDGTVWDGSNIVTGKTWKMTGTITVKGVTYKQRAEGTFAADAKSYTYTADISTDGKTWTPWTKGKMTKQP